MRNYSATIHKLQPTAVLSPREYPVVTTPLRVSTDQVLAAIKSFPPGSSGGSDGLRPQHLKDMTDQQVGDTLSLHDALPIYIEYST